MGDDLVEFKPKIGPLTINGNAIWKKLFPKDEELDLIDLVAQRFLRVFNEHGVPLTQIRYFLPQITLDTLSDRKALLTALTPETLDQTAQLFGIRRNWLDGVDDQIYEHTQCYKVPGLLFHELSKIPHAGIDNMFPVRALYCSKSRRRDSWSDVTVVLVLQKLIGRIDENDIYQYRPITDEWSWDYWKSRLQLKVNIRLLTTICNIDVVPLYRVEKSIIEGVAAGELIPRSYISAHLTTEPSLEDFTSFPNEHAKAREYGELPKVLAIIEKYNLESYAYEAEDCRKFPDHRWTSDPYRVILY